MSWQILLVINLFTATIRELLNKKIANKLNPMAGIFYIVLFSQFWIALVHLFFYKTWPQNNLNTAWPGILFVIGFGAYFSAIRISLSQSILFQSYSIIVTIILSAIFLGEGKYLDIRTATGLKVIIGIILAFAALWKLLHVGNKKEERLEKKWFLYIMLTIIFMGVGAFVTLTNISHATPLEVIFNQGNGMLAVILLYAWISKKSLFIDKKMIYLILVSSIFSSAAVTTFYQALLKAPVAKLYPLQQISLVILTIIGSYIFFQEKKILGKSYLKGMILGLIGILLLVTS